MLSRFSCLWFFAAPWTVAPQAPSSMGFSRKEYWSGLPCSPPGEFQDPGNPGLPCYRQILYRLSHQGSPISPLENILKSLGNQRERFARVIGDIGWKTGLGKVLLVRGLPGEEHSCQCRRRELILGGEDPLEEGLAGKAELSFLPDKWSTSISLLWLFLYLFCSLALGIFLSIPVRFHRKATCMSWLSWEAQGKVYLWAWVDGKARALRWDWAGGAWKHFVASAAWPFMAASGIQGLFLSHPGAQGVCAQTMFVKQMNKYPHLTCYSR